MNIFLFVLYFAIYSFLGWLSEVCYCYIIDKKLVNRGFLNGPICPVYGFGAIFVILILGNSGIKSSIAIFLLGAIIASIIEYITSYLLEKLFKSKLWDYSNYKFNIRGRVCLLNSSLFGVLSVVLLKVIHPFILRVLSKFNFNLVLFTAICITIIFAIDFFITLKHVLNINKVIKEIDVNKILEEIHESNEKLRVLLRSNIQKRMDKAYPRLKTKYNKYKKR